MPENTPKVDTAWFAEKILALLSRQRHEARQNFFHSSGGHLSRWLDGHVEERWLAEAQHVFDELQRLRLIYQTGEVGWFAITPNGRKVLEKDELKVLFPSDEGKTVIFLSHASSDEEIAHYLKAELERRLPGLRAFLSCDPADIVPGRDWSDEIRAALKVSKRLRA